MNAKRRSSAMWLAVSLSVAATGCTLEKVEEIRCSAERPTCPGKLVCDGQRCVEKTAPRPDSAAPQPDEGLPPDERVADGPPPDRPRRDAVADAAADAPPGDLFAWPDAPISDAAPPDMSPADGSATDGGCTPGATMECYTGPPGTVGVGTCQKGQASCGDGGLWGPCFGQVTPMSDVCDGKDNDCNGAADPGCSCLNGASQPCGTDVGECVAGVQFCQANGQWGSCNNSTGPSPEQCDALDHDCDGDAYNGLECAPGDFMPCTTACGSLGERKCTASCTWGTCYGPEVCNGCDDDGDTLVDEGFQCALGATGQCDYFGDGSCKNANGTRTCGAGCVWGSCTLTVKYACSKVGTCSTSLCLGTCFPQTPPLTSIRVCQSNCIFDDCACRDASLCAK